MHYYIISYNKVSEFKFLDITLELDLKDLNQDSITLQLPVWRPGRYERANFYENIKALSITNNTGTKVNYEKISTNAIHIQTKGESIIRLTYKYYANIINSGSSYVDKDMVYVNPINCCFYILGQENSQAKLKVILDNSYKLAIGEKILEKNFSVQFNSIHELLDTPFIGSNDLKIESFNVDNTQFNLVFCGECKPDFKLIKSDFELFCKKQLNFMGGFPIKAYSFLFLITKSPYYHGVEHTTSTVITLGPSYKIMLKDKFYNELLGVSSHELFHVWNIKLLRPKEMYPYDYSKPMYSKQGFIYEGVTTYLGDYFLLCSKVFDWKQFRSILNTTLTRYFNNFGRKNLSLTESSFDTWVDGYKKSPFHRKVSIYNEGALVAFMMDYRIRKHTNNTKNLVSFIKHLYNTYALNNKGYSYENIISEFSDYTNTQSSDFFNAFVSGKDDYQTALEEASNYYGCKINRSKKTVLETKLGVMVNKQLLVNMIHPKAEANNYLVEGDKVISINNLILDSENKTNWIDYFSEERMVKLTIKRDNKLHTYSLCIGTNNYFMDYTIDKIKEVSEEQKNNFEHFSNQVF